MKELEQHIDWIRKLCASNNVKSFLLIFIFTVLSSGKLFAYPISPIPLSNLILQSEHIVVAKVDNSVIKDTVQEYDPVKGDTVVKIIRKGRDGDDLATLEIRRTLKGKLPDSVIRVEYRSGLICPAPPRYPDGEIVIAFLEGPDSSGRFRTYGLSYGTKLIQSESELEVYAQRIKEYLEITELQMGRKRLKAVTEWLVKCVESAPTRWDGAYVLSEGMNNSPLSFSSIEHGHKGQRWEKAYDRAEENKELYRMSRVGSFKVLSNSHMERLETALFESDTLKKGDLLLLNIVEPNDEQRLKDFLLDHLSQAGYFAAGAVMEAFLEVKPAPELRRIRKELWDLDYDDEEKEAKTELLVERFIEKAKSL